MFDLAPEMMRFSKFMLDSVRRNFIEGGRPTPWQALKMGGPSALFAGGDLVRSITSASGDSWAEVSTSGLPYARIHQEGGETHPTITQKSKGFFWWKFKETGLPMWKALALKYAVGEKMTVNIPARPFMMFQEEDIDVAKSELENHIVNFYNAKGKQIG
jgi:phage gpG-like protein